MVGWACSGVHDGEAGGDEGDVGAGEWVEVDYNEVCVVVRWVLTKITRVGHALLGEDLREGQAKVWWGPWHARTLQTWALGQTWSLEHLLQFQLRQTSLPR